MFEIGEAVVDRENKEPDTMRVLNPDIGFAFEVEISELGQTVYQVNSDYPPLDPVAETVFEGWLDSHVPNWIDWPSKDLHSKLQEYTNRWSISVNSYYYPRSRLKSVHNSRGSLS